MHSVLELNLSQWLKPYNKFNTQQRIEAGKKYDKDRKVLYKSMSIIIYGKTMEKWTNRIDVKLVTTKKTI